MAITKKSKAKAAKVAKSVPATKVPAAAPVRIAPSQLMTSFDEMELAMDRMFERLFPPGWHQPWRESMFWLEPSKVRAPRVDVIDHDGTIIVRAELPGIEKKDIDVSVGDDSVTIRGRYAHEGSSEQGSYFRREMSRGEFTRTLSLPGAVEADKCKASFKDGILELTLQKSAKAKRRSIKIA